MYEYANVEELLGVTLSAVVRNGDKYDESIYFFASDGRKWKMYHVQDCCEAVTIEDICGDLEDLVGSPITLAEESSNHVDVDEQEDESKTWTFYRFATAKGYVTIRWYGESNGYYSQDVTFIQIA